MKNFKRVGVSLLAIALAAAPATNVALATGETYKLNNSVGTYSNAGDAANKTNRVSTYQAGDYYIYRKYNNMINISKVDGRPGAWINPSDNLTDTTVTVIGTNSNITYVTNAGSVNARAGAGTGYSIVGVLSRGDRFEGELQANGWIKLTLNGRTAYVYGSYFRAETLETRYVKSGVNVRSKATSNSSLVGRYSEGEKLEGHKVGNWLEINHEGSKAYVYYSYTQAAPKQTVAQEVVRYTTAYLNVRNIPSTSGSRVLGTVPVNTKIEGVIEGDWIKHTYNGTTGYSSVDYLTAEQPVVSIANTSSNASVGDKIAARAKQLVGYRYVFAAASPSVGFDCSGLVYYLHNTVANTSLTRRVTTQWREGYQVSYDEMKPGDAVFFGDSASGLYHVGIYVGNGQYVHASTPERGVVQDSIYSNWFKSQFYGARRLY